MRLFADDSVSISEPLLRRAFTLALNGLGTTSPNPMVGCVIAHGEHVVGEGWHERPGGPHAEVAALARAGAAAQGATAYVTLEPCAHHGRTPPCVDALLAAGVAEVVLGMADPTPVAAGGAERLRSAGVRVRLAADPTPFLELNEGWLSLVQRGRPWVVVKVATTLDGKVAERLGVRTSISCEEANAVTMMLRARSDVVMVGASTALTDECVLTVRTSSGEDLARQPVRVVHARTTDPARAPVLHDGRAPTAVLAPHHVSFALPPEVEVIAYPGAGGTRAALEALGARGVTRALVETGPRLFTAMYDDDLIDELVVVTAGRVFGPEGVGMYAGQQGSHDPASVRGFRARECSIVGNDVVTAWRRVEDAAA